ncbi:MAG: hypothetical protein ABJF10_01190 [Chthoniobacter sp.]|uniref:hypothetical protein n=1 Tax=Chthoniobacter sp. TaxID=2510640 RepID=UPI0032A160D1
MRDIRTDHTHILMNIRLLPTLLAAATLLFAGCLPESKNPLSTPATSTIDARLEGIYVARRDKKDDDLSGWHFHYRGAKAGANGKARSTPWLEVLDIEHRKDGGLKGEAYRVLTTHLGGRDYMSFIELGSDNGKEKASLYSFARYEVSWAGDIRVWLVNSSVLAQAIKSGKLRGTVKTHKNSEDVLLTDSTEHLAAFVAASDPATLFGGKPMVLYRLAR